MYQGVNGPWFLPVLFGAVGMFFLFRWAWVASMKCGPNKMDPMEIARLGGYY